MWGGGGRRGRGRACKKIGQENQNQDCRGKKVRLKKNRVKVPWGYGRGGMCGCLIGIVDRGVGESKNLLVYLNICSTYIF